MGDKHSIPGLFIFDNFFNQSGYYCYTFSSKSKLRQKELAKNINIIGVSRSLIITIIIMALKVILGAEYWVAKSMFGINLASGSVVDNFTFAAILFVLLLFVYSLSTFISLVAVNKGWEYFLSVIFILLGSCFFIFKSLVLLFLFGRGLATLLVISVILTFMINLINYKFINNFEYKS